MKRYIRKADRPYKWVKESNGCRGCIHNYGGKLYRDFCPHMISKCENMICIEA